MVNKLDLNNELITLRTHFAKAKARAINKLTRKLKSIEHGKKKDPANAKLDSKTTKLVEELKLLKAATKLGTVKKVFIFSQDPDKVLKLQKSTAEQRAICRLLMNPFLKDAVAVAKKKLDIKDGDEEWKKLLFEMGKNKSRKLLKEKKEAIAGVVPTSAGEKTKKPKKKGKPPGEKGDKLVSLDDKSKTIDKKNRKEKFDQKRKQFMKAKPGKSNDKSAPPASKPTPPASKPAPPAQKPKRDTPSSPPKKVNIFPMESKDQARKPNRDFGDMKKKWNPDDSKRKWNQDDSKKKWNQERPAYNKAYPAKPQMDQKFQKPKFEKSSEKLHPSWEAKKQKKPAISEFKGKKTTFDD